MNTDKIISAGVEEFQKKHDGDCCLEGCIAINGNFSKDVLSEWLRTYSPRLVEAAKSEERERIVEEVENLKERNTECWYQEPLDDLLQSLQ